LKSLIKIFLIVFTVIVFPLTGCKTEKNTFVNRQYHNTTAYFNVYYNGVDAYKTGMKKIDASYKDNYSLVLPVFKYSNKEAARAVYSDMNRAIEKGAKCVRKHSITKKPKKKAGKKLNAKQKEFQNKNEFVAWIDDAYLLIGKANLIKGEYFPAIETFSFIIKQYGDIPAKYEAYLWLARTYTEMGKYDKAMDFLSKLQADKEKVPYSLTADIEVTYADILIRQGRYADAIPYLDRTIPATKNKKKRTRYQYLLAQLYQEAEMNNHAYETYGMVINAKPEYEMAFNAKINRASIFNASTGDSKELERQLYKMLKDDKNIDYQDQIYYALAKIAYLNGNEKEAIELYKTSTKVSKENTYQKSISYLAVADIYFARPDYENANMYYDSTITYLDSEHPDYKDIKRKTDNLNKLVLNLRTIATEDSLQRVATMSVQDRNTFIDNIIKQVVAEENLKKELEAQRLRDMAYNRQQASQYENSSGGKWYFYNPAMISMGAADFKSQWGDRKNEDNWRRKNKTEVNWELSDEEQDGTTDSTKLKLNNKTREFYMVDLPVTDSAITESNNKIEQAYYNLATIYFEKFADEPKSIETYNILLSRFPNTEKRLMVYYSMFKMYTLEKNTPKANEFKNKIIAEYPESDYAKILLNPEYYKTLDAMANKLNFMYKATYQYFINENCAEVETNYTYVNNEFSESKLMPKFELLHTLCRGRSADTVTFKSILTDYIEKYKGTDEAEYANEVLFALDREFRVVNLAKIEELKKEFGGDIDNIQLADSFDISMYNYNPNAPHCYVIVVNNQKADENLIAYDLRNFNLDYYDFLTFDVTTEMLSASYNVIKVTPFKNAKMVSNYYESVIISGEVFENIDSDAYRTYIMTEDNYKKLFEDKNIARFQQFFEAKYTLPH